MVVAGHIGENPEKNQGLVCWGGYRTLGGSSACSKVPCARLREASDGPIGAKTIARVFLGGPS